MKSFYAYIIIVLSLVAARAEDWSVAGRNYQNVRVTKVEADCVHVMYDGGIGSIKLADLPPDIQKRFNYSPTAAEATSQQREADRLRAVKEMEAAQPAPAAPPTAVSASSPISATPSQGAPATTSKPGIDRAAVQYQINQLNSDIAQQEREVSRNAWKEVTRQSTSQNPYRDIITQERAEVAELTAQLSAK